MKDAIRLHKKFDELSEEKSNRRKTRLQNRLYELYNQDYQEAGIPTIPSRYGFKITRVIIAISSILAALSMGASAHGISLSWGYMRVMAVLALGLLGLAVISAVKPSQKLNFGLFKFASIFMLGAMVMIVLDVL